MILHGRLKFIVLKMLSKKAMTGNQLRKEINNLTDCWTPSPGSMYPLLKKLLEDSFISVSEEKNLKFYSLTKKGTKLLESLDQSRDKIKKEMISAVDLFSGLAEKKDLQKIKKNIEKSDFCRFEHFNMGLLNDVIEQKVKKNSNKKKIREILSNTIKQIQELD